jgi:hypothetical protein
MKIGWASIPSTSVVMSFVIIPALLLAAGIRWGFTAEEQASPNDLVDIQGSVIDEDGKPVTHLPVSCKDSQQNIVREVRPNEKGEFTLLRIPNRLQTIECEVGDDRIYAKSQKKILVNADTQLVVRLNFRTIEELHGRITGPQRWKIQNALFQVTRNGLTFSEPADEKGEVIFKKLRAGPATVKYSADGVQAKEVPDALILEGSSLSASLLFDWFPYGLLLLIPAVVVLALRAGLDLRWEQTDDNARYITSILIIVSLLIWVATFLCLWLMLRGKGDNSLHFFHPALSFSLAVPIFGFLGTLLFVIDVCQKKTAGKQDVGTAMEFVLRLVLGPYVAIVMVLLFSNTFSFVQVSNNFEAQATVAFFSGFLVLLVLQGLSEKGNELLGQWRNASRYEPSEIARVLNLAVEEDLKLKKVNLKYLDQLRMLKNEELAQIARQSDLAEGFLLRLKNQALLEHLKARIGESVWNKLKTEGISSIWDLAPLTEDRIQALSQKHNIDPAVLTRYSDEAKELLKTP